VARLSEGEALRAEMGMRAAEIFVLDGLTPGSIQRMAAARLTPALTSLDQIAAWAAYAGDHTLPCALHFDTGMNRLGLAVDEAEAAAQRVAASPGVELTLVMSHLSFATSPDHPRNRAQLERFRQALAHFPGVRASLAASAGAFLGPDYRFDMVRPGISLYGGGPEEQPHAELRAVAVLEAPVLQVRTLRAGDPAGYGAMFTAPRDMTIALVEAGYADGILRTSFAHGHAAVRGRLCPLAIVTMDLIAVDVGDAPDVGIGDMVELLGSTALLDRAAAAAGTVAHECLVRLSPRAGRIYRD
ncbi:MAG: alanine racemase, partial [Caulobacteraceae bacterium]|nr:alanine racemase [Caulobacteraceae bacterium]